MTDAEWLETLDNAEKLAVVGYVVAMVAWSRNPDSTFETMPLVPEPLQRRVENYRRVREYFEMPRRAR